MEAKGAVIKNNPPKQNKKKRVDLMLTSMKLKGRRRRRDVEQRNK